MILLYIIGGLGVVITLKFWIIPFFKGKYTAILIYRFSKKMAKISPNNKEKWEEVTRLSKKLIKINKKY